MTKDPARRIVDDLARRAVGLDLTRLAQDVRIAHCARGNADHPCVGACTITPAGVDLQCRVCGDEKEPLAPSQTLDEVRVAKAALAGLGVDWEALAPETQRLIYAMVKATGLVRHRGAP